MPASHHKHTQLVTIGRVVTAAFEAEAEQPTWKSHFPTFIPSRGEEVKVHQP